MHLEEPNDEQDEEAEENVSHSSIYLINIKRTFALTLKCYCMFNGEYML